MASKEELIASIKKALQGEMDSVNLYQSVAKHTDDPEVREFFLQRLNEERGKYNHLLNYYQQLSKDLHPIDISEEVRLENLEDSIFSESFIKRIGENQILFSAISTALLLEKDAIDHYRKCEANTEIKVLKDFFAEMVVWKMSHYDELLKIQKDAERFYWQENRFEPF